LPGFPLRTQVTADDGDIISTLVAVKTDPLSDAEFLPPKDFAEMKMPNIKISSDSPEPRPSAKP
jgi:hypothetical protein